MLPGNIALFVDEADERRRNAVLKALSDPDKLEDNLACLGRQFKIDVRFKEPVRIRINRYKEKEVTRHTFAGFFREGGIGMLCYATRRSQHGTLTGFHTDSVMMSKVEGYDLVDDIVKDEFKTYEQFARRFDRRFITEDGIKKLWAGTSSQHGGKYKPSDFHAIGPKGRRVVRNFMLKFVGIDAITPSAFYTGVNDENGTHYNLRVCERADWHTGRDISISHTIGFPWVYYSSEYAGCGNGRYGLLATERTFLWLEDD